MEEHEIVRYAKEIEHFCAKTTNCLKCPLFSDKDNHKGFCRIEGLLPWEWDLELDESTQVE